MLITLKELLAIADEKGIAFASFNAPNYESALAVIEAGEELNLPVILSHGPGHDCFVKMEDIIGIYKMLAERASVDVCIHLDHTSDLDYIRRALEEGVTSVMFDGSHYSFEENIKMSKEVVEMAKKYGASVEAELGKVANSTFGHAEVEFEDNVAEYTNVNEAIQFVNETGIDALAVAIGTVHGVYTSEPKLDLPRVKDLKEAVNIPLVMHGGSGVKDDDVKVAITNGIRKINYYTYMSLDGGMAVKEHCETREKVFFHDVVTVGKEAMKADVLRAMKLFSTK